MTRPARLALGAASALPALAATLLPPITDAVPAEGIGFDATIAGTLVLLVGAIGAVLALVWIAAGMEDRSGGWRLGWALGLTLFGAVAAPVFWALYVRPGAALSV